MSVNEIYQYSIISALIAGAASDGLPLSELTAHGNHGLGTFRHMAGEMIVLDGEVYQMKSDGSIRAVDTSPDGDAVTPFAMVTRFEPTTTFRAAFSDKNQLADLLSRRFPAAGNSFLAYRIDGSFKSVTVRTVDGQRFPGELLEEMAKRQVSLTSDGAVRGSAIGFRSPAYSQGISVAGDHVHFITRDRKWGGHVLALAAEESDVEISAAEISNVHLRLPRDDKQFSAANLECQEAAIVAIEG